MSSPQPHQPLLAPPTPRASRRNRRDWVGLLHVLPAIVLVAVFFLIPLGMTFWISLHDWPLMGTSRWNGIRNYQDLWGDRSVWRALRFTVEYSVVATIGLTGLGFLLALIVQSQDRLVPLYRTACFMPVVTGFASASLLWAWLSNVDSGLFSRLFQILGLTEGRVNLLASFTPAFWSVTIMVIWKMVGFYMIILMSGLHSIPADYQEAARIDGMKGIRLLVQVMVPLVRPGIVTVGLFAFLNAWNEFLAALVLLTDQSKFTLPVLMTAVRSGHFGAVDGGAVQAGVTIMMIPCLILFLILQRSCIRGQTAGAVK